MTIREQLAANLAYYRKKAGFTQKGAASALGTKPTTLSPPAYTTPEESRLRGFFMSLVGT